MFGIVELNLLCTKEILKVSNMFKYVLFVFMLFAVHWSHQQSLKSLEASNGVSQLTEFQITYNTYCFLSEIMIFDFFQINHFLNGNKSHLGAKLFYSL